MSRRLTIDVGNSAVGVGHWVGAAVSVQTAETPEEAAAFVDGPAAVVSVAPARLERLLGALSAEDRAAARVLEGCPLPVDDPRLAQTAGADRLANALALLPGPGVVVDTGTAVTVDVVDEAGCYRGGFIGAGPAAAGGGLAAATAQLPRVAGRPAPLGPAVVTEEALAAGLWGMAVGGVDRLVEAARSLLVPQDSFRIVATGGWAAAWARCSRHRSIEVVPDHIHHGIALWAERDGTRAHGGRA